MPQHVLSSLGQAADRKLERLAVTSRERYETIKKKSLGDLSRDTKDWVKRNPRKTLLAALATGILAGWLLGRR